MAEFCLSLNDHVVANQIANMLNRYNRWATTFSAMSILSLPTKYFVEMHNNRVIGCAGIQRDYATTTKIQHICVLPEFRKLGIAKMLVNRSLAEVITEFAYMTIREDNVASLTMAESSGFRYISKHWFRDHWTLTYAKQLREIKYNV